MARINWFGTVRARLGLLASDRLLIFGSGGFAYGEIKQAATMSAILNTLFFDPGFTIGTVCTPVCYSGSRTQLATGWAAGAGGEYAVTPNVAIKLEYLYVNLGSHSFNMAGNPAINFFPAVASQTARYTTDFHVGRVGVNWKF